MPESVNYRTSLGALQGKETAEMKRLSETHAALEMNYRWLLSSSYVTTGFIVVMLFYYSKIGNDERRTREGYKADQKKQAFLDMEQLGDSLRIHPQVVKKAQEEFASYRDKKEAVQQYDGVVAACLALAFREIGRAGGNVLKAKPGLIVRKPTEVAATRTISDTAIAIHTDCPMKSWDLKKVKDWLLGVAGGEYAAEAEQLFHLVKEADCKATPSIEDKSRGQRYPSTSKVSFLGTTTVAGRKKKLMERTLTEVIKPTAGQHLLRLYLGRIRFASERDGEDDAKHPLKDAIRRRLDFDKQRVILSHLKS